MLTINPDSPHKPCDYFDVIGRRAHPFNLRTTRSLGHYRTLMSTLLNSSPFIKVSRASNDMNRIIGLRPQHGLWSFLIVKRHSRLSPNQKRIVPLLLNARGGHWNQDFCSLERPYRLRKERRARETLCEKGRIEEVKTQGLWRRRSWVLIAGMLSLFGRIEAPTAVTVARATARGSGASPHSCCPRRSNF